MSWLQHSPWGGKPVTAALGLCTLYKLGNPVGKEMRVQCLIVPTKVQSHDWPRFETMPMPTAVL